MATHEKTWNVANRLHSLKDSDNPEVNHIIAGADEIYDDTKGAKQSDINAQADSALADRYTKAETYSKEQLDALITTPDVNYVSVVATNATTAVTDILPATGEANTIYRVGNWNGTQYDPTMYALYAWNGSAYVCLAVRSFVGEVYDVSVNHPDGQGNPTAYADLTAALGTDGANIPADIRRGGMSIKFIQGTVQSYDNNYVQYMYKVTDAATAATFTDVANWEKVNLEDSIDEINVKIGAYTRTFDSSVFSYIKVFDNLDIKTGEKAIIRISSNVVLTRCIVTYNDTAPANRLTDKSNISTIELDITAPADINSFYILAQSASTANISFSLVSKLELEIDTNRKGIENNNNKIANVGYFRNSQKVSRMAKSILEDLRIKTGEKIIVKVKLDTAVTRFIISTDANLSGRIIDYDSSSNPKDTFVVEYTAVSDITALYSYCPSGANAFLELFSRYTYDVRKELEDRVETLEGAVETLEDVVETNTDEITKINEDIYTNIPVWELVASPQVTAQGFINISNGNISGYPSYNYIADYINIEGTDFVKLVDAGNTSSSAGYVFYTKNGDSYEPILPGGNQTYGIVIAVPSSATHIRFSTGLNYNSPKIYKQAFVEQLTISKLRGKKIVCFGDSITEFTDGWGKSYTEHIADITGATVINVGIGGSYYRERTTPELNPSSTEAAKASLDVVNMVKSAMDEDFTYQVNAANYLKTEIGDDNTAIITRLSQIDWSTVDIVTFFAGTNDWNNSVRYGESGDTDPETTLGAINTIIQEILTNYPAIKIYFFTPIVRWLNYSGGTGDPAKFSDNFERSNMTLRQFCKFISDEILLNHIPVYDAYNLLGWNMYNFSNYFLASDGTHPYKGFGYIAQKFVSFLEANY